MKENGFFKRRQSIIKVIVFGLVLLAVCLWVCVSQISLLENTYKQEVSQDFYSHHTRSASAIDEIFNRVYIEAKNGGKMLGNKNYEYGDDRIYDVINSINDIDGIDRSCFITDSRVYHAEGEFKKGADDPRWAEMWDVPKSDSMVMGGVYNYYHDSNPTDGYEYMASCPVYYDSKLKGYFIVMTTVETLFENELFSYQNDMGECYLIEPNKDSNKETMNIVSRSQDCTIMSTLELDFLKGITEHSDEKDESKKEINNIKNAINDGESGFVSITTKEGNSLQISYCPLEDTTGVYYVSCYNDNLVDDKVQPLIFKNVVSSMILIAFMIVIIIYIWATAKKNNITIEKMAFEDPVTNGKNINYFKEFAVSAILENSEVPFVIYRFDIVNFRFINEAYGHERADEVLKAVVRAFGEIFSEKELCVRMNADQFLAIIVNDKDTDHKLNQLTDRVTESARNNGVKYPIKFKQGVYQVKKHDRDIEIMIDHANVARKTLKSSGKELRAYFTDDVIGDMRRVDTIESDMQKALAAGEFKVYYQPKWDVVANHVAGAEALIRWERPDGSVIKPEMFIPIFEKNGFVEKLDFYTLEEVCKHMRESLDKGKTVYPVSVNQSRLLLHSLDYVDNVNKIIKKYNIPENAIELEITETVFTDEKNEMYEAMRRLKECGVKLSMDDFGSGYSSLNMLKDAPFDIIKIDKEFFSESVTSDVSLWILQKMIEMINGLGMEVICEGVETGEQALLLRSIGCRMVQGFFYAKPMPYDEYDSRYC